MSQAVDRTYRSLRGLEKTASTSRVLNLAALAARNAGNPEHDRKPFFLANSLNGAVIVRHGQGYELLPRVAADKVYERDATVIVLDHGQPAPGGTPDADDAFYSKFEVPDDLIW